MAEGKLIGFIFIEGFADWEFGLLAASQVEYMGGRTVSLTPASQTVTSIGTFGLNGERGLDVSENVDLDAIAVIGSDGWAKPAAPDVSALLGSVHTRGGVVGGICAGTLAVARSGLFEGRRHTSNGQPWIAKHLEAYRGAEMYRDVPHAVADDRVVSAPGSAPGTFAMAFLKSLYPDRSDTIDGMRGEFSREYALS